MANSTTKIRRRTGILAASALRDLARLRYASPVKLDGRVTCAVARLQKAARIGGVVSAEN